MAVTQAPLQTQTMGLNRLHTEGIQLNTLEVPRLASSAHLNSKVLISYRRLFAKSLPRRVHCAGACAVRDAKRCGWLSDVCQGPASTAPPSPTGLLPPPTVGSLGARIASRATRTLPRLGQTICRLKDCRLPSETARKPDTETVKFSVSGVSVQMVWTLAD